MEKRPLNYESKSRRKRGPMWLLFFAAVAYGIGGFLCRGQSVGKMFGIMELVTIIVLTVAGAVVGIRYGTQNKDYWA